MSDIGDSTPDHESDEDKLIEYCLIEKSSKILISLLELRDKTIIIGTDSRGLIDLTKVDDIIPDGKYKEQYR